jgi:FAD synthetase
MTRVLVFGTFDGLHPGHMAFLQQAKQLGDELVVCVAPDEVVTRLKGRAPVFPLTERLQALQNTSLVTEATGGDLELGGYDCYQRLKPDLVAFGYDQQALAEDFQRFQQAARDETPRVVLKPYHPETYKSSLLRG